MNSYFCDVLSSVVASMSQRGQYPTFYEVSAVLGNGDRCIVDGKECIHMGSNGYLGLQKHPEVIEASTRALQIFGLGSTGSRITAGTTTAHLELESKLAEFEGTQAAIVFSSGYLGNVGLIHALSSHPMKGMLDFIDPGESARLFGSGKVHLIFDELVHRSLISGIEMARGNMAGFSHPTISKFENGNYGQLKEILAKSRCPGKLVILDSVFSLHGRITEIDKIVKITEEYDADVYADEAHATGIFGKKGRGMVEEFGCEGKVRFRFGTLSKAVGAEGGFFAGTKAECDGFRVSAPWIFSTSVSPAVAAGATRSIEIIMREPERRHSLLRKAKMFRDAVENLGFDTLGSSTQIVPIRFYTKHAAQAATLRLMDMGIFAPCYWYPAVGKTEAMVRMNIMATHTDEQLEYTIKVLKSLRGLAKSSQSSLELSAA